MFYLNTINQKILNKAIFCGRFDYQKYMKEIEKAKIMLRIKMVEEVKIKVAMEEGILFKAMTKEEQTQFLERRKQKDSLK
jgi:hypothetical protein